MENSTHGAKKTNLKHSDGICPPMPNGLKKVDIKVTIDESDGTTRNLIAREDDDIDNLIEYAAEGPSDDNSTVRRRNASTGSNASSVSSTSSVVVPPDGGWGWVVVFASFIAHCIADGCAFSFGIFYMTLKDSFNESDAKTSLVGSIFAGVPLMAGPIASAVTNKFGCRRATMFGTVLAASGFIASYFATSLDYLILSLGIVSGFGFSLIYMSAIVVVAFYFQKKRALATGLAVSGTGIGTMIFAPMCEMLIVEFGWRGTFLIIGGIITHIFACGLVFRPNDVMLEFVEESSSSSSSSPESSPFSSPTRRSPFFNGEHETEEPVVELTKKPSAKIEELSNPAKNVNSENKNNNGRDQLHTFPKYKTNSFPSAAGTSSPVGSTTEDQIVTVSCLTQPMQRQQHITDISLPTSMSLVNIPTYMRTTGSIPDDVLLDLVKKNENSEKLWHYLNRKMTITSVDEEGEVEEEYDDEPRSLNDDNGVDRRRAFSVNEPITIEKENRLSGGVEEHACHARSATVDDDMKYLDPSTYQPYQTSIKGKPRIKQPSTSAQQRRRILTSGGGLRAWQNLRKDTFYPGSLYHTRTRMRSTLSCPNISQESGRLLVPRGGGALAVGDASGGTLRPPVICGIPPPRKRGKGSKKESKESQQPEKCCSVCCNFVLSSLCCTCCTFCVQKLPREFRNVIYEMLDISLFLRVGFLWFCISNFLLYAAYDIPYYYVPEYAVDVLGVEERKASFLISVIGIVSTVGQVAYGWFGDLPGLNVLFFYAISLAVCGAFTICIPAFSSYPLLIVYCSAFGFFISANYALSTIILVDIVTLDRLTNAYGLLMFAQGLANTLGPPLAGLLSDMSGSHVLSFYVAGSGILVSGVMLFLLRPLEKLTELWASTSCCRNCNVGFKKVISRAICCGNPESTPSTAANNNKSPLAMQAAL